MVTVFVTGFDTDVQTEDGVATVPMVLQGILVDYDEQFLLLGDNENGQFSMVNFNNVCKIDTVNENEDEEPSNKPSKANMN